jgi:hypothetical protein
MSEPVHTAAAEGDILVALADHRIARVAGGKLVDVPNAVRWGQPDW